MRDKAVIAIAGGLAFLALIAPNRTPILVWNATASAPRGLYRLISTRQYHRGDLVLVDPPAWVRELAARRRYLPDGVPLVKRIAATAGDQVCSEGTSIHIDGVYAAQRLITDAKHRVLPRWAGCHTLWHGEELLLMRGVRTSFDGRYFGVTPVAGNRGKLVPLWTY